MNTLIKEIHSSFSKAQDVILSEAKRILHLSSDERADKAKKLKKLGFKRAKNIRALSQEEIAKAKALIELKQTYEMIAPNYKFITEEKRLELCKKYGLVMAEISRFTGEIPDKNVDDILNFKITDNSYLVNTKTKVEEEWESQDGRVSKFSELNDSHIINIIHYMYRRHGGRAIPDGAIREAHRRGILVSNKELSHSTGKDELRYYTPDSMTPLPSARIEEVINDVETNEVIPEMYIVSDIGQLDTKGVSLDEDKMFLSRDKFLREERAKWAQLMRDKDPIVLVNVKGGYLIVTAWGDEAADELVVNPRNN